jgi:hypothetical protein
MEAFAAHRSLALIASLVLLVSWPLAMSSVAKGAPSAAERSEEQQLGKEAEGLTDAQRELLVRTLDTALLVAGIHPSQLSQAERAQIAQLSGQSLPTVNTALDQFQSFLHKDNPDQIPIGTPIALIYIAAALIFAPAIFNTIGGTLYGGDGAASGVEGIPQFGK